MKMDYFQRIQKTIDYIEDNLENELTLDELAKMACFSKYYYHRLFSMYVGQPVMGYIRKRRLAKAVTKLDSTDDNILKIAVDYQFESQEVFTRAFSKYFDITPGKYRKLKAKIKLNEKISVLGMKSKKRRDGIQPKLVIKEKTTLIGMTLYTTFEENLEKLTIANFHNNIFGQQQEKIHNIIDKDIRYGICESVLDDTEGNKLLHTACVEVSSIEYIPDGMQVRVLPPLKYLAFTHKGKVGEIADTFSYIFQDYLPNSNYELSKLGITFQIYKNQLFGLSDTVEFDIYVSIE